MKPLLAAATLIAVAIVFASISGCGAVEQRPPEQRTTTVQVKVEVPVPCFTEAERPIQPEPTPIDIDKATPKQLAFALHADQLADKLYMDAVENLFLRCQAAAGIPIK